MLWTDGLTLRLERVHYRHTADERVTMQEHGTHELTTYLREQMFLPCWRAADGSGAVMCSSEQPPATIPVYVPVNMRDVVDEDLPVNYGQLRGDAALKYRNGYKGAVFKAIPLPPRPARACKGAPSGASGAPVPARRGARRDRGADADHPPEGVRTQPPPRRAQEAERRQGQGA